MASSLNGVRLAGHAVYSTPTLAYVPPFGVLVEGSPGSRVVSVVGSWGTGWFARRLAWFGL